MRHLFLLLAGVNISGTACFQPTTLKRHTLSPQRQLNFHTQYNDNENTRLFMTNNNFPTTTTTTRTDFLKNVASAIILTTPLVSNADDDATAEAAPAASPVVVKSIEPCPKVPSGKPNNCVSTFNIKNLDTYSPPWTYEVSPEEAYARLKGLFSSTETNDMSIIESDEANLYLKISVQRNLATKDIIEFQVKPSDSVILFKSTEDGVAGVSDFGVNRSRMETLRKKSGGVFELMGGGLTADSYSDGKAQTGVGSIFGGGGGGNGPLGQLKAFYGLQSGQGFEDVFAEE